MTRHDVVAFYVDRCLPGRSTWKHAAAHDLSKLIENREVTYAECQGISDPICGLARLSVHGCNEAPTRAEVITFLASRGLM